MKQAEKRMLTNKERYKIQNSLNTLTFEKFKMHLKILEILLSVHRLDHSG